MLIIGHFHNVAQNKTSVNIMETGLSAAESAPELKKGTSKNLLAPITRPILA